MTAKVVKGESGDEYSMLEWEGFYLPSYCNAEQLRQANAMEFRQNDIIVCAYPKCGTHWVFEMVAMLVGGEAAPVKDVWYNRWLEHPSCDPQVLQQRPSPRVLTSHFPHNRLPGGILQARCPLVVVERNIKDAAVSLFAMTSRKKNTVYTGTWDTFLPMFLSGNIVYHSYFDHVKSFRRAVVEHPEQPTGIFSYEAFKQDHLGELARLSRFLGLDASPQLLADIVALTNFKSMKTYKKRTDFDEKMFQGKENVMFRKGEVGDWKNWFTVAQSEMVDAEHLRQMGEPFKM